jgi:phosphocarrier protein HPr
VLLEQDVRVVNRLGVHARPAASIVQTVLNFECEVHFLHNGARINAKSIMGLLTLAATQGTIMKVICEGSDAEQAMVAVKQLFANGFGEE